MRQEDDGPEFSLETDDEPEDGESGAESGGSEEQDAPAQDREDGKDKKTED
jgi:hypothetical protein